MTHAESNHKWYLSHKEEILKKEKEYRILFPEKQILRGIKQRCNNLNRKDYKYYGGKGIKCLITSKEIKKLMIRDDYWNMKIPTIDRINNDGNYEFSNCRFIEQADNTIEMAKRILSKPVLQFTLTGKFIKEWKSQREASRQLNIPQTTLRYACNGILKNAKGSIWKLKQQS